MLYFQKSFKTLLSLLRERGEERGEEEGSIKGERGERVYMNLKRIFTNCGMILVNLVTRDLKSIFQPYFFFLNTAWFELLKMT